MTHKEWGNTWGVRQNHEMHEMYADWTADRDYQRRHRKWALKEAYKQRELRWMLRSSNKLADWLVEQAEAERDHWRARFDEKQGHITELAQDRDKLAARVKELEEALDQWENGLAEIEEAHHAGGTALQPEEEI